MKIKKCSSCSAYTMKDVCPKCGAAAKSPRPPKFSPEDKYGRYRRISRYGASADTNRGRAVKD